MTYLPIELRISDFKHQLATESTRYARQAIKFSISAINTVHSFGQWLVCDRNQRRYADAWKYTKQFTAEGIIRHRKYYHIASEYTQDAIFAAVELAIQCWLAYAYLQRCDHEIPLYLDFVEPEPQPPYEPEAISDPWEGEVILAVSQPPANFITIPLLLPAAKPKRRAAKSQPAPSPTHTKRRGRPRKNA